MEEAVGQVPPSGTGPDALEDAVGKLPPAGTGPDALDDVVGKLPPAGTGPDALEEAVSQVPPSGTGPDALEEAVSQVPPSGTGPDALDDVSSVAAENLAPPPPGTEDALSQVGPALEEPVKEIQDETKRADRDAVPEAAALVGSLFSNAKAAVTGSPLAPSAPPADTTPPPVTPSAPPDTPTPVDVSTPVQIAEEESPSPPVSSEEVSSPASEEVQPHAPLNLKFGPDVTPTAPEVPKPVEAPLILEKTSEDIESINERKAQIAKEKELKTAATLTESKNFGQSNTPETKQGVNVRATRRAKAAALRKAKDASDALRGKIEPLFGGRNRRGGNRWTHRRKR